MTDVALSELERTALKYLVAGGGGVLVTAIPEKSEKVLVFGGVTPGHTIYRRLEKAGLCYYSEPVVTEEGFEFTGEIYVTESGRRALVA